MAAAVQNLVANDYNYPMPEASNAGIVVARPFIFTLGAQANPLLSATSTIKLVKIPGSMGIVLLGAVGEIPDLDSSTNVVLQLGDSSAADTFITTTLFGTVGQVAGRFNLQSAALAASGSINAGCVLGVLPKSYTTDDNLILTIQAGPTTATTGTIKGVIYYSQFGVGPSV